MSLMDKVKGVTDKVPSIGEGSATDELADDVIEDDEFDEGVEDEFPEEGEDEFGDEFVEENDEIQEWDNAYEFAMEHLEEYFTSGAELAPKIMAYDVERSDLYRDRIQSGVNTINSITSSVEDLKALKGDSQERNWEEKAEKLSAANEVIDSVDKLSGREDQIVDEVLGVAKEGVEAFAERSASGGTDADVDTSVTETEDEI